MFISRSHEGRQLMTFFFFFLARSVLQRGARKTILAFKIQEQE